MKCQGHVAALLQIAICTWLPVLQCDILVNYTFLTSDRVLPLTKVLLQVDWVESVINRQRPKALLLPESTYVSKTTSVQDFTFKRLIISRSQINNILT